MSKIGADISIDQIDDWFKIGKPVAKINTVNRSSKKGDKLVHADPTAVPIKAPVQKPFIPPYKRHHRGDVRQTAYAAQYQQEEEKQLTTEAENPFGAKESLVNYGGMESLEADSTITGAATQCILPEGMTPEEAVQVYKNYNMNHKYNENLPITKFREGIIDVIESNQVTVIQGPTGSGKTTQVPQYILDHYADQKRYCNIIVTQPRRIAAISIARRVSSERSWQLGGMCGYQIGMEKVCSDDTRLVYCTTGVLLQKLIGAKNMHQYTHVILDEVHERDQDSDFCLLVVRRFLRTNSRDVKVVLMSATFDTDLFANYFALPLRGKLEPAPVFTCEGRMYRVSEYYIEDLKSLGELPALSPDRPSIPAETFHIAKKLILEFDRLEIKEQGESTIHPGFADKRGSVLVFLPGLGEINEFHDLLYSAVDSHCLIIFPLHSSITGDEQAEVFKIPDRRQRKVILSTNIAESSITVPDIKYVIDFCLTKEMVSDPETNYSCLQHSWASKANCKQRKGRAGRVSDGRVYRMVTRDFYHDYLSEYGIPEMQRCPLDHLVLQVKLLDLGEPKAILGLALSPPNLDNLEMTILQLQEVGALTSLESGGVNPHDGDLTFLGRVLASLPVDIRIGKLILLGYVFGLLEECIIIGASMSLKSFFATPFKAHLDAYRVKLSWALGSLSDSIAYLNAFRVWERKVEQGYFAHSSGSEANWGRKNFIQIRRIKEVKKLVDELRQRLSHFNIKTSRYGAEYESEENLLLLKLILCGAFYPNYFLRSQVNEEEANRSMSGMNPCTTVMVRGLPANHGTLYKTPIENLFKSVHPNPIVHFEETRAYIEFPRATDDPGAIPTAVYAAIKMKQLRIPLQIEQLDADVVFERMKKVNEQMESKSGQRLRTNRIKAVTDIVAVDGMEPKQVKFPPSETQTIRLFVTHVVDCGHFWAHYGELETWQQINALHLQIQKLVAKEKKVLCEKEVHIGKYCLAPYEDATVEYYRARVDMVKYDPRTAFKKEEERKIESVTVFFLDYGNRITLAVESLRVIEPHLLRLPFQAMECQLSHIKPSPVKCPNSKWTAEAKNYFEHIAKEKRLVARVYSIVHNVLRLTVVDPDPHYRTEVDLKKCLIHQGFAEEAEESWASNQNNMVREEEAMSKMNSMTSKHVTTTECDDWLQMASFDEVGSSIPHNRKRATMINLVGPWSPYELRFHAMPSIGRLRDIKIDQNSVNSVALDCELQDPHDLLMVGGFVRLNPTGSVMLASDTTILPNIRGLPALVTMLFTPCMELRTNRAKTCYTGALCGLGWNADYGGPAFPDHDIEVVFDTEIDLDDLMKINAVRVAINLAIGSEENIAQWTYDAIRKIQRNARKKLLDLIQRKRESVAPVYFSQPCTWQMLNPADELKPNEEMTYGPNLYTLHSAVALHEDTQDDPEHLRMEKTKALYDHLERLHEIAYRKSEPRTSGQKPPSSNSEFPVTCQVCNVICKTQHHLKIHMVSCLHRQEELRIKLAFM